MTERRFVQNARTKRTKRTLLRAPSAQVRPCLHAPCAGLRQSPRSPPSQQPALTKINGRRPSSVQDVIVLSPSRPILPGPPATRGETMTDRIRDTLAKPLFPGKHHVRIIEKLGPCPGEALSAMAGYGMSDHEIARYYGLTRSTVKRLRRILPVRGKWAAD